MVKDLNRGWDNLPDFSKALYHTTYFLPEENYPQWLERVSSAYANDDAHKRRMQAYIFNYWFHPSTPPSSNAGTDRGFPIACFTGDVPDTKLGIFKAWEESAWLGSKGGGVGRDWSKVREINHEVGKYGGESSGIVPFMCVDGALSRAISQGGIRRFSQADYLDVSHPEIEEFIEIRSPFGDPSRRDTDLHHGVVITDDFMEAVIYDLPWDLKSPKDNSVVSTVSARTIWNSILNIRTTLKGEPYLLFKDTVNNNAPAEYKVLDYDVVTSNLCTEITLRTDEENTGVCCLGSINAEYWDEWKDNEQFIKDCMDFLDNILQDFINQVDAIKDPEERKPFLKARNSANNERSIGLGIMGLHSLFQRHNLPFGCLSAKYLNQQIVKRIDDVTSAYNETLPPCPMNIEARKIDPSLPSKRNIHVTAIAPTMSISSLCNVTSSGIEPWVANAFTKKVNQGSFPVTNKYLAKVIEKYADSDSRKDRDTIDSAVWIAEQWLSIKKAEGSVQHLEWMDDETKEVFKTAFEIDQNWVIEYAADRQPFISQSQSVNLFIPGNSNVQYVSDLHIKAWRKGVKSLYYLRSNTVNRATTDAGNREIIGDEKVDLMSDTCLSCT